MKPTDIKKFRIEHGMTQEDLAHKLMVDATTVQRWESGRTNPHLRALQQLINLLDKRSSQQHPLLDALLAQSAPFAVLDEYAIYRRINSAFLELFGFADRAEIVGQYGLDVSPVWKQVMSRQSDPAPELLVFGNFNEMTIADSMPVGGQMRNVTHRISALKQKEFSSLLIHEIEFDDIDRAQADNQHGAIPNLRASDS